ncbi:MAG: class GN sortase [Burkholderiales bacterium]
MSHATDRGGPFVRQEAGPRNWMRASAPGIAFRFRPDESSPIGGASPRAPRATWTNETRGPRVRLKRAWTLAVAALAVGGALAFGEGAYIYAKAGVAQALLQSAWAHERATGVATRPWPWADTHPVARLSAPARGGDVLVLAGASGRTLAFGPGHLDGSAQPGDPGNSVITAHRDTHFRFLRDVQPGDEIAVERADGTTRHFRIRRTYVADQGALALPRETAVPTLTLVTCYPFDALNPGGPLRYVVVAEAAPMT